MSFSPAQLIRETFATLFRPQKYFAAMPVSGGFLDPVIKAALYGLLSGAVLCALGLFKLTGVPALDDPEAAAMALLAMPLLVVLLAFVGGALLLAGALVCKGTASFEACVRCTASLLALEPVNLLADTFALRGHPAALTASTLVTWFALYLAYHALTQSLGARKKAALVLTLALALLNTANTLWPLLR